MLLFFIFLFGLIIGSFLNVLIERLYLEESITGRSRCPSCKKKIVWYDNIPILSFLVLKGKCRHCNQNISLQYPAVEFITALLFTLAFYSFNRGLTPYDVNVMTTIGLVSLWYFIAVLIVIFVIDARWYVILDKVTIPAIIVSFFVNIMLGHVWYNLLISAILGGGFFFAQFALSKGRWVGGGDIRLGFLMGCMLGYPHVLLALMLSYMMGGIIAIPLLMLGKKHFGDKLPFGTFLSLSTIIILLYGDIIYTVYVSFIFS